MKIIVDAMGGDNAPLEIVRGALDANRKHGVELTLVGRTAEILRGRGGLRGQEPARRRGDQGRHGVVEIAERPGPWPSSSSRTPPSPWD